jgi:transposase
MDVLYPHCAGLDVHKKTVVACVITPDATASWHKEIRSFGTMTADLLALSDWLQVSAVTHVAMESTGEYWRPIFNILEGNFDVLLVNAQHIKAVPGRKTDVKDAEWIADLLQHGLLRGSFIPPVAQRDLRDLTRTRSSFVRERVNLVNRVQKTLEGANIKLASVASDVMGVSGRAMLAALIDGHSDPATMAELSKGRLRQKRTELAKALEGRVKPHHRFILAELLAQIDSLDETLEHFDHEIAEYVSPFDAAVILLDTIPGVGRETAELRVSEIGTDMSRFPTADHLAAWAGLAPGQNESAGKRRSGRTRPGNQHLRAGLTQAAHAATSHRNNYLAAQYHRLVARRGKKKAIIAVAHSILIIAYHLIERNESYQELGGDYFDKRKPEATAKRLVKRLERLGYAVTVQVPVGATVQAPAFAATT